MRIKTKADRRHRISLRLRKRIAGTPERPRLAVFRSVSHIYAQVIDDQAGVSLVAAATTETAVPAPGPKRGRIAAYSQTEAMPRTNVMTMSETR